MKSGKMRILALCLCLLCLWGCGNRTAAAPAAAPREEKPADTLETPSGSVQGRYEGETAEGVPEGEGSFTALEGWSFRGSFSGGVPTQGSVEDMPLRLTVASGSCEGTYTGSTEGLIPQGEGSFRTEAGGSFTGSFQNGGAWEGTAEDLPCTVLFRDEEVAGRYTGPVSGGVPEGEGDFVCDQGRTLSYSGGWSAGAPAGPGTLTDDALYLTVEGEQVRGRYEGEALAGVPEGGGVFTGRTGENISFTYSGEWRGGLWNGQGSLIYDSELYYDRVGTFTDGVFTPDWRELLRTLGSAEPHFTLAPETEAFLEEYPELMDNAQPLPRYEESDYRLQWNRELTYDVYQAAPEDYLQSWMLFYSYIVLDRQVDETFGEEWRFTRLLTCNSVYERPMECFLFGDVPDLEKWTRITFFGVPLGQSTYTNSDGESIPVIVVLVGSLTGY